MFVCVHCLWSACLDAGTSDSICVKDMRLTCSSSLNEARGRYVYVGRVFMAPAHGILHTVGLCAQILAGVFTRVCAGVFAQGLSIYWLNE